MPSTHASIAKTRNASARRYVVGVDVGGTNIKLGIVDPFGKVIARNSFATAPFTSNKNQLINALAAAIQKIAADAGLTMAQTAGVGIGLPGPIDYTRGVVRFLPNIPGWNNVPLAALLRNILGVPVYIDNDVKLITLAEWHFGAGRQVANMICLTLGTGVGSGLILNNKLYRGDSNAAGELGHVPLNEDGPACNCGGFGCLEAYIGNRALVRRAEQVLGRKTVTLEEASALAHAGNRKAIRFWTEAAEHLGNGLVTVVNLLNPSLIVIGGGVSNNHAFLFKTAQQVIERRAMNARSSKVKIIRAVLGNDAGILGAQVLVKNAE